MTDGSKPLSVLQLQNRPGDAERLVRQQREQHERIQELQSQRDEALQQAHAAQQELERLRTSLAQHRRQLAAATQLFWEDRAGIARLEEERRALNLQLDRLRLGLLELAETPAAKRVRQALLKLV